MGRPTFKIDHTRLRALRKEQGLTQTAIAEKVSQLMGTPLSPTLARHYQRIEENGKTSVKFTNALATVLGVSAALLQGLEDPDPGEYRQYIRRLLQTKLDTGSNIALQALLQRQGGADHDTAVEYLTETVVEAIEDALLIRQPEKVADLVRLTGIPEADLLVPANARGFWFLSVSSSLINCTEVVNDVTMVNYQLREIIGKFLGAHGGDSTVRMWRDQPWVRIEILRPRVRDKMRIDFTRCQPDGKGLRWIEASWQDDFFLDPGLMETAYANADVVTDFAGKTAPGDLQRLRFVITTFDGTYAKPLRRIAVRGDLDNMPDTVRENFAKESLSRKLYVNWLTAGLREILMPLLGDRPASEWHVSDNGASAVDIKSENSRFPGADLADLRYRIMLMEEVSPDTFERVPLRPGDLVQLHEDIARWISEATDQVRELAQT